MPERIQRKRVKGWKMPPNTVSVTRPGRYGNPYTAKQAREAGYKGSGHADCADVRRHVSARDAGLRQAGISTRTARQKSSLLVPPRPAVPR